MAPYRLDVIKFQERCNPIRDNCWGLLDPIICSDVEKAINNNDLFQPEFIRNAKSDSLSKTPDQQLAIFHITNIARFVVNGWNDPIHVDVGVPSLGCYPKWPLEDGNHRFAAAIIRGDNFILANMSGATNEIQKFLYETQNDRL